MNKALDFTDSSALSLIGFTHPSLSEFFPIREVVNPQLYDIEPSLSVSSADSLFHDGFLNSRKDLTGGIDHLEEKHIGLVEKGIDKTGKEWQKFLQKDLASNNGLRPVAGDLISFDTLVPPLYQPITLASKISVLTVVKND